MANKRKTLAKGPRTTLQVLPLPESFKCPCDGENDDCVHCEGTGWTTRQVVPRARRTLSLDHPSPVPFRSKLENFFDRKVNRDLPSLRQAFSTQEGDSSAIFVSYLRGLAVEINFPFGAFLGYTPGLETSNDLKSFASSLKESRNEDVAERLRILESATKACTVVYKNALAYKVRHRATPHKPTPQVTTRHDQPFKCLECGTMIYDQKQHNRLFHPRGRVVPAQVKAPTQEKQARTTKSITAVLIPSPAKAPPNDATPQRNMREGCGRPSIEPEQKNVDRARADTGTVERDMDARRTWGGRFRDTNGSFGSYPVHDSMDDESNAG